MTATLTIGRYITSFPILEPPKAEEETHLNLIKKAQVELAENVSLAK